MGLSIIYHFQSSQNQDELFIPASYRVIYFFSAEGFLTQSMLQELARSVPEADPKRLTFLSLDELKDFALRVSQELGVREVRLISVLDYNIGLDGAKDQESFKNVFNTFGELLINETAVKKKNFFGKLFT